MVLVYFTATAVPPHRVEQQELKEFARGLFAGKFQYLERLLPIFDNGLIETRYLCQRLERFGQEWSFRKYGAISALGPGFSAEHVLFRC